MVNPREKEMAEMRARYAKIRGQKKEEPKSEVKEEKEKENVIDVEPIKKSNPYIRLIKDDIRNLILSVKKILGVGKRQKPLDISWLEKNNRRFWK